MSKVVKGEGQLVGPRTFIKRLMLRRERKGHAPYEVPDDSVSVRRTRTDYHSRRSKSHKDDVIDLALFDKSAHAREGEHGRYMLRKTDFSNLKPDPIEEDIKAQVPLPTRYSSVVDDETVDNEDDPCWKESHMSVYFTARDYDSRFRERYFEEVTGISGVCKRKLHTIPSQATLQDIAAELHMNRSPDGPTPDMPVSANSPDITENLIKDEIKDEAHDTSHSRTISSTAASRAPTRTKDSSAAASPGPGAESESADTPARRAARRRRQPPARARTAAGWIEGGGGGGGGDDWPGRPSLDPDGSVDWRRLVLSPAAAAAARQSRAGTRASTPSSAAADMSAAAPGVAPSVLASHAARVRLGQSSRGGDGARRERCASADSAAAQALYAPFKDTALDFQSRVLAREHAAAAIPVKRPEIVERACGGPNSAALLDNKHRIANASVTLRALSHNATGGVSPRQRRSPDRDPPPPRFSLGPIVPGRNAGAAAFGGRLLRASSSAAALAG